MRRAIPRTKASVRSHRRAARVVIMMAKLLAFDAFIRAFERSVDLCSLD